MANKINHWCVICGKGYHACDSCDEVKSFTPWRALTDTSEHYKIFLILKQFNNKLISKGEAKSMLANIDLSGKENFKESAKKVLTEILKEDIMPRKAPKKKVTKEETVEVETVVDISDAAVDTEKGNTEE